MDVDGSYPTALYGDAPPSGVRLLTAVHIACIDDGGAAFGLEFSEDELQDFFDSYPHRYFEVKPRGNLKKAAALLSRAVCTSIQKNELKLLAVRKNLKDELSLVNSWVSFDAFAEWCETRSISLGDGWFDFAKDDCDIAEAGFEAMEATRRRLEGFFSEDVADLKEGLNEHGASWLLDEAASLRAKLKKCEQGTAAKEEKPLATRERNTLLATIGALLELVKNPRDGRDSDAAVIRELVENYSDKEGISKRKLEEVFPLAKRLLTAD